MIKFYRTIIAIFIGLFAVSFGVWKHSALSAPLLANYYIRWDIPAAEVDKLAKWDLVILDMEVQVKSPAQMKRLRELNPDIILLAYVGGQDIADNSAGADSVLRRRLIAGVPSDWYLNRPDGQRISYWPGTTMLNPTDLCPSVNGRKWNDYLPQFMVNEVLSSGLWDGVFYDNVWGGVRWFTGDNIDLNRDGSADTALDERWHVGLSKLFAETRRLERVRTGREIIIVGNSITEEFSGELNGIMLENFQTHNWPYVMKVYNFQAKGAIKPKAIVINSTSDNTGRSDSFQAMRYGLTSALLGDGGYFAHDSGDQNHGQIWWYDEYDVNLGAPTGVGQALSGASGFAATDVYRRDYANGLALVNPTGQAKTVDLGGEYEKIIGTQDKFVNSGGIVSKINLPARDGIILRKTFQQVNDAFFVNGGLVRFFTSAGARARNGFFAFVEGFSGGARIFQGDLDGAVGAEKIVAEDARLRVFDSSGRIWHDNEALYGEFPGRLNLAVGRLDMTKAQKNILVAGERGGALSINTYYGAAIGDVKYPLGKKYKNGFFTAIGDVDGGDSEVILGAGRNAVGEVIVMDKTASKIKKRFYPYGKTYKLGVAVGAADVNGDGRAEILTVGKVKEKIIVKIFNAGGKVLKEFSAGTILGSARFNVGAVDMDNDGRMEIVVGSE